MLGFKSFVHVNKLYDQTAGYLVNNMFIIKAKVATPIVKIEDLGTETSSKEESNKKVPSNVNSTQAQIFSAAHKTISSEKVAASQDAPAPEPFCIKASNDDVVNPSVVGKLGGVTTPSLIEFKGLDEHFVPLLEEVCKWHPSLIECQKNRTPTFRECAFKSLGKLLHILKTTMLKDLTEEIFADLQQSWEEVNVFGFDLSWLKPYVQSVPLKKNLINMSGKVTRLREYVDGLEIELKRQRTVLIAAEVEFGITRSVLAEPYELDLNCELGYGRK